MSAFVTVAELREFLQVDSTQLPDNDPAATLILTLVSDTIRAYLNQAVDLVENDVVILDPNRDGSELLVLPQWPVLAVDLVEVLQPDGTWLAQDPATWTWTSEGLLRRIASPVISGYPYPGQFPTFAAWPVNPRSVRITYDHGYAVIPDSLRMVCMSAASRIWANPTGVVSESIESYSVRYDSNRASGVHFSPIELVTLGRFASVVTA